jgi:hypothetical protein
MNLRRGLANWLYPVEEISSVTVKVDGKEKLVSIADLVRAYQKNAAADNRLREATAKLRAAERAMKTESPCSAS